MKIVKSGIDIHDPRFLAEVPTELTLFESIKNIDFEEFSLVNIAGEKMFHKMGGAAVQSLVDRLTEKKNKNYIIIFQHVWVDRFNWRGNIVFSPHVNACCPPNIKPIPHYPLNTVEVLKDAERDILFSFVGAGHTHPVREKLIKRYSDSCINSGEWLQSKTKDLFFDFMKRSKFSLCPRGTGVGTVRLFECMAMRSVPVILSDDYIPPLNWMLDWNEFSVSIEESKFDQVHDVLSAYSNEQISEMSEKAYDVWRRYFCPKNMHKVVEFEIERIRRTHRRIQR